MFQKSYAVWEVLATQNMFYFPGKQWSKLLWSCAVEFSHTYQRPSSADDISNNNTTLPVVISGIIEYVSSAISLLFSILNSWHLPGQWFSAGYAHWLAMNFYKNTFVQALVQTHWTSLFDILGIFLLLYSMSQDYCMLYLYGNFVPPFL